MQQRLVRVLLHSHERVAITGVKQQEVSAADLDALLRHRMREHGMIDQCPAGTEAAHQIDQHATSLYAGHRHVLDAQTVRARSTLPVRTDEIYPRPIAVVVDRSFDAAAVDID